MRLTWSASADAVASSRSNRCSELLDPSDNGSTLEDGIAGKGEWQMGVGCEEMIIRGDLGKLESFTLLHSNSVA